MLKQIIHSPTPDARDVKALGPLTHAMQHCHGIGEMPWVTVPQQVDDIAEITAIAAQYRNICEHVVLCGTGGSSLGAKTLADLVTHPLGLRQPGVPQLHIVESTDSETLSALLRDLPAERTGWIFISKSGSTLETLTQFLAYLEYHKYRRTGPRCVITMPGKRPLRDIAEKYGIPVYDHAPKLGGRFSVFSLVGLLPAAIVGLDIGSLRQGAVSMLEPEGLAMASDAACWQMGCLRDGYETQIAMPYARRLGSWTYWYRQLWAESLGKSGKGSTPLSALGPVDQHSMLQLFLDGPSDKSMTLVQVETPSRAPLLAIPAELTEFAYLGQHSGSDIVNAQAEGTLHSLLKRKIPLREIHLSALDEHGMGALLMLGMIETVFTAALLEVDAFDQPAVEESKQIAFASLQSQERSRYRAA